jgi:NADPH:quinone reductase-like Zn-dependent oxidoreductase
VEEIGKGVSKFKKGDRVVIDTPSYNAKESKYGGWQKYIVGKQTTAAKIADTTSFENAAAIPYALLTAVAGLQLKLGMEKPGANKNGKVLIWGASGSVGGYAVQYAKSVRCPTSKGKLPIHRYLMTRE